MLTNNWLAALASQVWSLPYLGTYLVGMLLSLIFWRRHPAVSATAVGGFAVLLLNVLFHCVWNVWLTSRAGSGGLANLGPWMSFVAFGQALVATLGFSLLITAIFGWREPRVPEERFQHPAPRV